MVVLIADRDCVAIFHSIHRVMKAEKILKGERLEILLIPVPRQLSADCGMAIRFSAELLEPVRKALQKSGLQIAELWQLKSGEYRQLL